LDEIFSLLATDEQFMFLISSGKNAEAIKLLPTVYKDPSIDANRLDVVPAALAYSGIGDSSLLEPPLRFGLESRAAGWSGLQDLGLMFENNALALSPLFASFPAPTRRLLLSKYLGTPVTHKRALQVLALVGTKDEMDLARADPDNDETGDVLVPSPQAIAIIALARMGDCSLVSRVNKIASAPRTPASTSWAAIRYLSACGVRPDPIVVRSIVQAQLGSPFGGASETLNFFRWSGGSEAIPSIRAILASVAKDKNLVEALEYSSDAQTLTEFRAALANKQPSLRGTGARLLAELGDESGLQLAAAIADDATAHDVEARAQALEALQWFKGSGVRRLLLSVVKKSSDLDSRIGIPAANALRWYDDDETIDVLVQFFSRSDAAIREAARDSLASGSERTRTRLREEIGAMDPISKVYCARALQISGGGEYEEVFEGFLQNQAGKVKDYAALQEATAGLRDSYIMRPAAVALNALSSPFHAVRLAAILALAEGHRNENIGEHLTTLSQKNDPDLQFTSDRARAMIDASERVSVLIGEAQRAVSGGDLVSASGIIEQLSADGSPLGAFYSALESHEHVDGYMQRSQHLPQRMDDLGLLQCRVAVRRGDFKSAMSNLMQSLDRSWFRKAVREDSAFMPLHQLYAFRVMTGLQEPITVENIEPPQSNESSAEASKRPK
jgi:hypothetical protein